MAERVGFEPTVLSHTAFRERHLKPLGHLTDAGESNKAGADTERQGSAAQTLGSKLLRREVLAQFRGIVAEDPRDHRQTPRQACRLSQVDGR